MPTLLAPCSVQYLQQPEPVFAEIYRVLKPGGVCIVTFSNRLFYDKAIAAWRDNSGYGRSQLVASYFQAVSGFTKPEILTEVRLSSPRTCDCRLSGLRPPDIMRATFRTPAMFTTSGVRAGGAERGAEAAAVAAQDVADACAALLQRPAVRCRRIPQLQARGRMSSRGLCSAQAR